MRGTLTAAEIKKEGFAAGLADPENGFRENPFLYGPQKRPEHAAEWWRGFDEARQQTRVGEELADGVRERARPLVPRR